MAFALRAASGCPNSFPTNLSLSRDERNEPKTMHRDVQVLRRPWMAGSSATRPKTPPVQPFPMAKPVPCASRSSRVRQTARSLPASMPPATEPTPRARRVFWVLVHPWTSSLCRLSSGGLSHRTPSGFIMLSRRTLRVHCEYPTLPASGQPYPSPMGQGTMRTPFGLFLLPLRCSAASNGNQELASEN